MFDEIGDVLRDELTPIHDVEDRNIELYKRILKSNSVCINVRRGDFFNTEFEKSFGVCTIDYYYKAFRLINNKVCNPEFFVFSDDIKWCKDNLHFDGNVTFVADGMPVYETLRLMYSCKHFIISNSTYSWWGQYLSKNKDKIVISPSRWNNDGFNSRLIQDNWCHGPRKMRIM